LDKGETTVVSCQIPYLLFLYSWLMGFNAVTLAKDQTVNTTVFLVLRVRQI